MTLKKELTKYVEDVMGQFIIHKPIDTDSKKLVTNAQKIDIVNKVFMCDFSDINAEIQATINFLNSGFLSSLPTSLVSSLLNRLGKARTPKQVMAIQSEITKFADTFLGGRANALSFISSLSSITSPTTLLSSIVSYASTALSKENTMKAQMVIALGRLALNVTSKVGSVLGCYQNMYQNQIASLQSLASTAPASMRGIAEARLRYKLNEMAYGLVGQDYEESDKSKDELLQEYNDKIDQNVSSKATYMNEKAVKVAEIESKRSAITTAFPSGFSFTVQEESGPITHLITVNDFIDGAKAGTMLNDKSPAWINAFTEAFSNDTNVQLVMADTARVWQLDVLIEVCDTAIERFTKLKETLT